MASSLMHLAVAGELLGRVPAGDPDRFAVGSVLPDAAKPGSGDSHFRRALAGGARAVMDAEAFRRAFVEALHQDYARLNRAPAVLEPVILSLGTVQDYIRRCVDLCQRAHEALLRGQVGSTPNTGPGGPGPGLDRPAGICLNRDVETGQRMREPWRNGLLRDGFF